MGAVRLKFARYIMIERISNIIKVIKAKQKLNTSEGAASGHFTDYQIFNYIYIYNIINLL